MGLRIDTLTIDARDPRALARFWHGVLGGEVVEHEEGEVELTGAAPVDLLFLRNDDEKVVKNRLHLDLRPDDQDAEVARVLALGARPVDIGQGEQTFVVLADPEGNELCILAAAP